VSPGQTTALSRKSVSRTLARLILAGSALGGLAALIVPFVRSGSPWQWQLSHPEALIGAIINAELVRIDSGGVVLRPSGERPISLITPPLRLAEKSNRTLRIRAAVLDEQAGAVRARMVRLLWQEEDAAEYRFLQQEVAIGAKETDIDFSLPAAPERIHRLGVQFADLRDPVRIGFLSLPALSPGERVGVLLREFAAPEPIVNHSVNFVRGPLMLGHALNYYLVALACTGIGACGLLAALRPTGGARDPAGVGHSAPLACLAAALAPWFLMDGWATWNLSRQLRADVAAMKGRSWIEQIAAMNGPEIAWAFERLLAAPAGSTFAVISDDRFAPAHRLAYLLAPARTRIDDYGAASLILVIRSGEAAYDARRGRFSAAGGSEVAVELVARLSDAVFLLKRHAEGPGAERSRDRREGVSAWRRAREDSPASRSSGKSLRTGDEGAPP